MAKYKPFLIRKLGDDTPVRNSRDWNIWVKSVPFKVFPDMKDIPTRTWLDEQGDDEFIPDNPFYKAYEIDCEFVYKGDSADTQIRLFLRYLAEGGFFQFYDTYTGIGRTNVRYVSYAEDIFYRREGTDDVVQFKVTLKVNDPITNIVLTSSGTMIVPIDLDESTQLYPEKLMYKIVPAE